MRKVAAVTGGAQGIGKAVALEFVKAGYEVSVADTDQEAGAELVGEIRELGGKAMFLPVNVSKEADIEHWFKLMLEELGRVDVLVNNAGIGIGGSMLDLPLASFDQVIGVNLRGAFSCSQHAARAMKQQGSGVILNMASTRGLMSEADTESYAASKGGLLALTHAMAVSLGPYGIRVNAISPGWIEIGDWQKASKRRTPAHSERDRLQHPVGRVGTPEDIAAACLYLADSRAGFITGQNLVIDGGMTVKMIYEE
ncbi:MULTISPECIES: glucose 1-dehydrogenase [unclassified Paenibacillus]|uniref:glucose 1-dehydrogenase n=1 Tax=unclassified Paenibacillus TaxID=185978 RepID=UPI001AE20E48|nr:MULTISPECIES: glucose 1-dehydrogenase [unclassified Paenibacillus]MBP1154812.1 NAD(P)-dependent dehydrogenase (short-subunit alcohol dehydrogenase family) [Paenibacillus sp. PvP091]MBP1169804.1 NAD(P)-dependent dehydrogenase (short-subunit alcohol dehydrogenase family) [Paenibacillus sp. PvR098]MBP2440832.1 NAD(P)-dependent dehydrogenase (short-subunit alcohol dehydrogenase family) [Paenibacillus sp. PvP052]